MQTQLDTLLLHMIKTCVCVQNKSEYYEHTLMQELKKNQHLQEYVRLLESRLQHTDTLKDWALGTQVTSCLAVV